MSIDITILQKGFSKKTLPLEVILGDQLQYGAFDGLRLDPGELGDGELIVYHPEHIARGICITWNANEKKKITLRSLSPSTSHELRDLYDLVGRITDYWKCTLIVDGTKLSPAKFQAGFDNMVAFNQRYTQHMIEEMLKGTHDQFTFFCAKWPLTIGKQEAELFASDPSAFTAWLHERQSMDVYFAAPGFEMTDEGEILGNYALTETVPTIFPKKPYVPFGYTNPQTGKALECNNYIVHLYSVTLEKVIGTLGFAELMERIDPSKISRYDEQSVLIEAMSLDEMQAILAK